MNSAVDESVSVYCRPI